MNNIFIQNSLTAIVFELQVILLMEFTEKREILAIINEKISDLVHDFMNFNGLEIILKIHKKLRQIQV